MFPLLGGIPPDQGSRLRDRGKFFVRAGLQRIGEGADFFREEVVSFTYDCASRICTNSTAVTICTPS